MRKGEGAKEAQDQDTFSVGEFRPEDAEGIVRLFRSVYGEKYPIKIFYDPGALTRANEERRYLSIVATRPDGDVIGVEHLYRSAPGTSIYEAGAGLVRKDCRSIGLNSRMLDYVYREYVPARGEIEEIFGEPVCNHPFMQKTVLRFQHVETGIEVALMPAEAYDAERSAPGRVATVLAFRCYRPCPHRVFLPAAYEDVLRKIYAQLDDQREIAPSVREIPEGSKSRAVMDIFDFARVARIAVHEIGGDFAEYLAGLEKEASGRGVVVFQVWLKLDSPWVGAAAERLRDRGYFFGGPLPRWFGCDGLLLQKVLCPPDFDSIVLESDFTRELLDYIRNDWERIGAARNKK